MEKLNIKTIHFLEERNAFAFLTSSFLACFAVGMLSGFFLSHSKGGNFFEKFKEDKAKKISDISMGDPLSAGEGGDLKGDADAEESKVDQEEIATIEEVCVDISGAVMQPGVVCLAGGGRVIDVLLKAGEFNFEAYASRYVARNLNLARPVKANEKIYIPFMDDVSCQPLSLNFNESDSEDGFADNDSPINGGDGKGTDPKDGDNSSDDSGDEESGNDDDSDDQEDDPEDGGLCIKINSASKEELMSISGIGPSTAQNIINGRPYTTLEQLLDVNGIGDAKYQLLLERVCL